MKSQANTAALLVFAITSCRRDPLEVRPAPEPDVPVEVRAPVPKGPQPVTSLIGHLGETVTIEGRVLASGHPRVPWRVLGKRPVFVELTHESGARVELVTHVERPPGCLDVRMTGQVVVARGYAKSGTGAGAYAELQLDVASAECR